MRKCLLLLCFLALACDRNCGQISSSGATATLTVIKAGVLLDGETETPRKNQLIFVRGERIENVSDDDLKNAENKLNLLGQATNSNQETTVEFSAAELNAMIAR